MDFLSEQTESQVPTWPIWSVNKLDTKILEEQYIRRSCVSNFSAWPGGIYVRALISLPATWLVVFQVLATVRMTQAMQIKKAGKEKVNMWFCFR